MINEIVAVIVLYKTKLEDSITFKSLINLKRNDDQLLNLFVYNNSPEFEQAPIMQLAGVAIRYEKDFHNSGLSLAYNKAAEYADSIKKSWLLLLDQDSELPEDFFYQINKSVAEFSDQSFFAPVLKHEDTILSPCSFKNMKGSALKSIDLGINSLKDKSIFNSGILVKLSFFNAIGGYNENISLDFSDHAFVHRVKKNTNDFVVMPIFINHEFSTFSNDQNVIYRRFQQYVKGIKAYYKYEEKSLYLILWTFLRAVKLTLKYKSFKFIIALAKK